MYSQPGSPLLEVGHKHPALDGPLVELRPDDASLHPCMTFAVVHGAQRLSTAIQYELDTVNAAIEDPTRIADGEQHACVVAGRIDISVRGDSGQTPNKRLESFEPEVNIAVGTQILREYTRRFGDTEAALQMYAGALDEPTSQYATKVLAEKARLEVFRVKARKQSARSA